MELARRRIHSSCCFGTFDKESLPMDEVERYLFDLNGYLVLPNVLSDSELAALNSKLDLSGAPEMLNQNNFIHTGFPDPDAADDQDLEGPVRVYNGLVTDWGSEFRDLVDHPVVLPYLEQLLGADLRFDHSYAILMHSRAGATSPHRLHNGGTPFDPSQYYNVRDNRMFNGLVAVCYALTTVGSRDGGFCVIPGSHKANFPVPAKIIGIVDATAPVVQVPMNAGDVLIFTEAITHGALPWRASHERRALLYKYAPGFIQWEHKSPWVTLDHPWTDRQRRLLTSATRMMTSADADATRT
jgi:Phytanoyl-CoA dioxygenase (PhyH)